MYQDFQEAVLIVAGPAIRDLFSAFLAAAVVLALSMPGLMFARRMLARARPER